MGGKGREGKPLTIEMKTHILLVLSCLLLSAGHIVQALYHKESGTLRGRLVALLRLDRIINPISLVFGTLNAITSLTTPTQWVDKISFHPFTQQEWRSQQNKRISKVRKTELKFKVTYKNGTAVRGARLLVSQISSDFEWGCAMTHRILNNSAYKKWFISRFTATDFHNELKWYYNEPAQGQENYADSDAMIKFAEQHNISIRGHTIFWDDILYNQNWVKNLTTDQLLKAAKKRVDSVVKRYRGKLMGWDVMNENLHHDYYEGRLGKNASAMFFNWVYNLDPNATLFMNEFNTTEQVNDEFAPPEKYLNKLAEIKSYPGNEGMKTGIGLESHYGPELIDIPYIRKSLSFLSKDGSPIWLTELDVKVDKTLPDATQLQVFCLEEILREHFAHDAVKGVIIWTGSAIDGCSVMCMTDENLNNTPVGDLIESLMAEWKSGTIELVANGKGSVRALLFHGEYEATVVDPVTNISTTVSLTVDKINKTFKVQINV